MPELVRVALGLEYDGTAYNGWQIQPHAPSVQQSLQTALAQILPGQDVPCTAAGRTDTGVHASGQVVHFDTEVRRSPRSWVLGLNSHLPPDIAVLWARPVPAGFHARYSAIRRAYRYRILNRLARSALLRHRVWVVHRPLDEQRMADAAQT
ncbi:MAG TPA: tRNA pseudouridine synthase A, partial [Chromatiales bacterium]|nr:tRNA pseudouridine synthase A [Chromatiales bacterium]